MKHEITPELQKTYNEILVYAELANLAFKEMEQQLGRDFTRSELIIQSMMQLYLFTHTDIGDMPGCDAETDRRERRGILPCNPNSPFFHYSASKKENENVRD